MDDQGENAGGPVPARAEPTAPHLGARARLPERFHYPMPGLRPDGTPFRRDELPEAVRQAAAARGDRSAATLAEIRRLSALLPPGSRPRFSVAIGAGASVAARDPEVLVVDTRTQWQVGNSRVPLPAADRIQRLQEIGMGDPGQFADAQRPVPLGALHFWEDTLAARGPLVDGMARFAADGRGRLLARIQPTDGSEPVVVEVEGTPVVATGVGQRVPGADRAVPSVPDALAVIADHLARHGADPRVIDALAWLPDREGTAQSALETLRSIGWAARLADAARRTDPADPAGPLVGSALRTLRATEAWDRARAAAPGRALWSDEVVEGRFDAAVSDSWLVAGRGGVGAAPETILAANPRAHVVQLVGAPRTGEGVSERYKRLLRAHDPSWGGDGRLEVVWEAAPEAVAATRGPGGEVRFRAHGREAGAYVAAMGRVPRLPGVLLEFAHAARVPEREITGELLFDGARQHLGYRVSVPVGGGRHVFEVAGSASRALPPRIFGPADIREVQRAGRHAFAETGGVVAGFVATAVQAVNRALHRHGRPPLDPGGPAESPSARVPLAKGAGARQRGGFTAPSQARRPPGTGTSRRPKLG
ncbi:hypothetical protein HNR12_005276 [Streptomonospora nanhaiensis]|uniref:Uncharacterized protein n=1 Tax=Streptomonospora nanhaiensis TaxID=1323731 RepID=A0A853BT87_9ACTN|nr:hypothetical protein [Streptomonospora nanhaiensis]NYI98999.1 hypothetical protein [Streptomonospora nanhaiensis]